MFTAAHELMHLYGPLQLQTDLTSRINLRAKNPSANLWMYEGFTEYLSLLMLYQQDLITENEFITEIRNKINLASYAENISLEDASKMYYMDGNEDMYRMFYNKGALTAMMLDLRLLKLSKGNLNLKKLLQDILNTSKQNYVLKDERVIEELAQFSYPEVKDFLVAHVKDTIALDINKDLETIGWSYTDAKIDTVNMYVNAVYRYTKASKEYFLTNISFDQMGFQEKDVLVSINKKRVTRDNLNSLLEKVSDVNFKKKVVFKVRRGNELVDLTGPPLMVTKNQKNLISIEKKVDIEKKSLRDVFRSGRPSGGQTYKILN
jgi:predicted metalloprotease with PDZ domain